MNIRTIDDLEADVKIKIEVIIENLIPTLKLLARDSNRSAEQLSDVLKNLDKYEHLPVGSLGVVQGLGSSIDNKIGALSELFSLLQDLRKLRTTK